MSNYTITDIFDANKLSKIIKLADDSFFKLSNKIFYMYDMEIGTEVEDFDVLLDKCIYPAIKYKLTELLSKKDYSTKDLYNRIKKYGYSEKYSKPIIEEFISKKFIDDIGLCNNLISLYSTKYGIYRIKEKLREKGIDKFIIEECISNANIDSHSLILKFLTKYDIEDLVDYKEKQKIINKLLYRGFSYNDINYAIEDYLYENRDC